MKQHIIIKPLQESLLLGVKNLRRISRMIYDEVQSGIKIAHKLLNGDKEKFFLAVDTSRTQIVDESSLFPLKRSGRILET